MMCLKTLFAVIFSLQLFTQTVLSASDVADDAQAALNSLSKEINATNKSVIVDIPEIWQTSSDQTMGIILEELVNDLGNFSATLNTISAFANNVIGGLDCISGLIALKKTGGLRETDSVSVPTLLDESFSNLFSLAKVEIGRVVEQFEELDSDFKSNCVENKNNCEGVSNYVIAAVERLLLAIKRTRIIFLAEVHVLGFKYIVYWKSSRSILVKTLNSGIKNATTCLASKIEDHTKETSASVIGSTYNAKDSLNDSLNVLLVIAENSYQRALQTVTFNLHPLLDKNSMDYYNNIADVRSVISRANQTVNELVNIAPEFNSTFKCVTRNLDSLINSSMARVLSEYYRTGPSLLNAFSEESSQRLKNTLNQVNDVSLQVNGCNADINCTYLAEKIAKKSAGVPVTFGSFANSTSVLMQQAALSVTESGVNIVSNVVEDLDVDIIDFKSCIRYYMY